MKNLRVLLILNLLLILSVSLITSSNITDMKNLEEFLARQNPKKLRPVINQGKPIVVNVDVFLVSLIKVDNVRQTLEMSFFFNITWKDELLRWNTSDFGGIISFVPQDDSIWLPLLTCYQCLEMNMFKDELTALTIYHDGLVVWRPQKKLEVICEIKVKYFPFDLQTVGILFFPMQYSDQKVQLKEVSKSLNMKSFQENGEWEIVRAPMSTNNRHQKSLLEVILKLKRQPNFFLQNVVSPIVLLSFLNLFAFCLPDDSGEKISFSLTMLLSQTVFLSTVSGSLPATSTEIVIITIYMTCLLFISCVISIASIILLYFNHKRKKRQEHEKQDGMSEEASLSFPAVFNRFINRNKVQPLFSKSKKHCKCTIDMFLFFIVFVIWALITVCFFMEIIHKNNTTENLFKFD